ncbi:hypothetical protein A3844_27925 [Paenibacillus helianthi]|uniref:Uncharacterized protein n=1 Tax=Paenibacillus helianthi TaxID=1349432 RepID=A0ABX3EJ06_9BACL|nr:hypothetical protein [Paenibacillus helianthi]OKP79936.1 hypothetical protein A3844_27925 [Paenibacillus helianthi]
MELIFKTADGRGLGAKNTVLLDICPFFVKTLAYNRIFDVYIETDSYQLQSSRSHYLNSFTHTAHNLEYKPNVYVHKSDWANPLRLWLIGDLIHHIIQFNHNHNDSEFTGVLFDIQPCDLPASKDDDLYFKNCIVQYMDTLEKEKCKIDTYNISHDKNFSLKIVMPRQLTRFFVEDAALIYERLNKVVHQVIVVEYLDWEAEHE